MNWNPLNWFRRRPEPAAAGVSFDYRAPEPQPTIQELFAKHFPGETVICTDNTGFVTLRIGQRYEVVAVNDDKLTLRNAKTGSTLKQSYPASLFKTERRF